MLTQNMPLEANLPTDLGIKKVNPIEHPGWNALIASQPRHTFFHTAEWAKVLAATYGYSPLYFTERDAAGIHSVLPLMEVDSWLTGRRGIGLPFTDDCEPICPDARTFQNLFQAAVQFGKSRNWKYLECRGGRELFGEVPASLSFYGHTLNLTAGEDDLFSRLEGSVRRAIRKAEKSGVTVTVSQSQEAMKVFYQLHCRTRKKHGLPPQPFAFFRNICEQIMSKNLGMIVIASYERNAIAASVYFQMGAQAIYKYGASDEAFQHLRGTNVVMWEAVKWHARNGAKTLNFGRTSKGNEGLRRYKLGWGADEHIIEYVKYDLGQNRFVTDTDDTIGWYNRVFSIMPMRFSRLAGAVLYRHSA